MILYVNKKWLSVKKINTRLKVAITGFRRLPLTLKKIYNSSACLFGGPGVICVS